jgi:hypothetical protein
MKTYILKLFIVSFFILLLYKFYFFKKNKEYEEELSSLVVCAYNENIDWISKAETLNKYDKIYVYIKNIDVYNKKKNQLPKKIKLISLPNIGSCDHVYLYHIIHNYDTLTNSITFSKGTYKSIIDEYILNDNNYLKKYIMNSGNKNNNILRSFKLDNWNFTNNKNLNFKFKKSKFKNLEHYLLTLFNPKGVSILFEQSNLILYTGYFKVQKQNVHRYKKDIYKKLISYEGGPNREIDHYYERIWGLLFSNVNNSIKL